MRGQLPALSGPFPGLGQLCLTQTFSLHSTASFFLFHQTSPYLCRIYTFHSLPAGTPHTHRIVFCEERLFLFHQFDSQRRCQICAEQEGWWWPEINQIWNLHLDSTECWANNYIKGVPVTFDGGAFFCLSSLTLTPLAARLDINWKIKQLIEKNFIERTWYLWGVLIADSSTSW